METIGKKNLKWLGKKIGTYRFGNSLFVKKYENGAILKRRMGEEITINRKELEEIKKIYDLKNKMVDSLADDD